MNATAPKTVKAANPCSCSKYIAVDIQGNKDQLVCGETTARTFAPGHDARLKGFLIRAGREGLLVRESGDSVLTGVFTIADRYGFGHLVRVGVSRVKAPRKPKTAKVEAHKTVTAKVGRWEYEGVVLAAGDGTPVFRYTNKKDEVVDTFKFTLI